MADTIGDARTAGIVAAIWPERCEGLVSVSGYLIGSQAAGAAPLPPKAELQWWYQYYFATERGRAARLDNPDHVAIVIHNYRWRLGLAQGEPKYDEFEKQLASSPRISVPTITLEGDANGAPHPTSESYAGKFSGRYPHRLITGGIGHNPPQEAPRAFADAIVDVVRF